MMKSAKISVKNKENINFFAGYLIGLSEVLGKVYSAFFISNDINKDETLLLTDFYEEHTVHIKNIEKLTNWQFFLENELKEKWLSTLFDVNNIKIGDLVSFRILDQIDFVLLDNKPKKVSKVDVEIVGIGFLSYYLFFLEKDVLVLQFC